MLLTHVRDLANRTKASRRAASTGRDERGCSPNKAFGISSDAGLCAALFRTPVAGAQLGGTRGVQHSDSYLEQRTTINRLLGWLNYRKTICSVPQYSMEERVPGQHDHLWKAGCGTFVFRRCIMGSIIRVTTRRINARHIAQRQKADSHTGCLRPT